MGNDDDERDAGSLKPNYYDDNMIDLLQKLCCWFYWDLFYAFWLLELFICFMLVDLFYFWLI